MSTRPDWHVEIRPYIDRTTNTNLNLFVCHSQRVTKTPPSAVRTLEHPLDPNAGLHYPFLRILTMQGHPESALKRVQTLLKQSYDFTYRRPLPVSEEAAHALRYDPEKMSRSANSLKLSISRHAAQTKFNKLLNPSASDRLA